MQTLIRMSTEMLKEFKQELEENKEEKWAESTISRTVAKIDMILLIRWEDEKKDL